MPKDRVVFKSYNTEKVEVRCPKCGKTYNLKPNTCKKCDCGEFVCP